MAALPQADLDRIWRGMMRYLSRTSDPIAVTKAELAAAVTAADAWVDSNAASYNSALPLAARNNLTTAQKSLLLVAVVLMRYGVALLRQVFGEVD